MMYHDMLNARLDTADKRLRSWRAPVRDDARLSRKEWP